MENIKDVKFQEDIETAVSTVSKELLPDLTKLRILDDVEETIYLEDHEINQNNIEHPRVAGAGHLLHVKDCYEHDPEGEKSSEPSEADSMSCFDILPDELVIEILSYLSHKDLCTNVSLVCKSWRDFADSPLLWQKLSSQETKFLTSESLVHIIQMKCPLLKQLSLKCRSELSQFELVTVAKSCPKLQIMSFSFCHQVNTAIVKTFVKHCPKLQDVNLEGCEINDDSLSLLSLLPLKRLNVSHCTRLSDDGLMLITTKCAYLQSINFDGVQWITDNAIKVMVQNCCEHLQYLWLDGANLSDDGIRIITMCKKLRIFSLSFCDELTDNALTSIQQMKGLYSLNLRKGVGFSAVALQELFASLQPKNMDNLTGLLHLCLAECSAVDDDTVQAMAESCPNILTMDLSWCWDVTDVGLKHIITNCHRMQDMTICGLGELRGEPFKDIAQNMPHLTRLDASQCNLVADEFLFELVTEVPKLTVINYYGEVL